MGGMHCICEYIYLKKTYGNPNGVFMNISVKLGVCFSPCVLFLIEVHGNIIEPGFEIVK